jgi:hypothetical protein
MSVTSHRVVVDPTTTPGHSLPGRQTVAMEDVDG